MATPQALVVVASVTFSSLVMKVVVMHWCAPSCKRTHFNLVVSAVVYVSVAALSFGLFMLSMTEFIGANTTMHTGNVVVAIGVIMAFAFACVDGVSSIAHWYATRDDGDDDVDTDSGVPTELVNFFDGSMRWAIMTCLAWTSSVFAAATHSRLDSKCTNYALAWSGATTSFIIMFAVWRAARLVCSRIGQAAKRRACLERHVDLCGCARVVPAEVVATNGTLVFAGSTFATICLVLAFSRGAGSADSDDAFIDIPWVTLSFAPLIGVIALLLTYALRACKLHARSAEHVCPPPPSSPVMCADQDVVLNVRGSGTSERIVIPIPVYSTEGK